MAVSWKEGEHWGCTVLGQWPCFKSNQPYFSVFKRAFTPVLQVKLNSFQKGENKAQIHLGYIQTNRSSKVKAADTEGHCNARAVAAFSPNCLWLSHRVSFLLLITAAEWTSLCDKTPTNFSEKSLTTTVLAPKPHFLKGQCLLWVLLTSRALYSSPPLHILCKTVLTISKWCCVRSCWWGVVQVTNPPSMQLDAGIYKKVFLSILHIFLTDTQLALSLVKIS